MRDGHGGKPMFPNYIHNRVNSASRANTGGSRGGNDSVAASTEAGGGLVGAAVVRGNGGALPIDPDPDATHWVDPTKPKQNKRDWVIDYRP